MLPAFLGMLLLTFAGCSKEEGGEASGQEVPDEVIEEALYNLETVDETLSPLFLECKDANELGGHLDEIKAMPGVEDAWVEDANSLVVKIENGGYQMYYYPPESLVTESDLEAFANRIDSLPAKSFVDTKSSSKPRLLLINQTSEDEKFSNTQPYLSKISSVMEEKGVDVTLVENKDFTVEFFMDEMPRYQFIFLITHGDYFYDRYFERDYHHWILTGDQANNENSRWIYRTEWGTGKVCFILNHEKVGDKSVAKRYVSVSSNLIRNHSASFQENSLLFNTACSSLEGSTEIWDAFSAKKLSCYLGFTGRNKKGLGSGGVFFQYLLKDYTAREAYDMLGEWKQDVSEDTDAYLRILPEDSDIRFFTNEISGGKAVDLGLSIKWASCNLGANDAKSLGKLFSELTFSDLYEIYPDLYEQEIKEFDIGGTKLDYAHESLGGSWRMPSIEEWKELKEKCNWKAVVEDNVPGFLVTGKNGNSIFFPAELTQKPIGSIYYFASEYSSSTLEYNGLKSMYLIGANGPYGIETCIVEEMTAVEKSYIRPVCP